MTAQLYNPVLDFQSLLMILHLQCKYYGARVTSAILASARGMDAREDSAVIRVLK